jgi:hypothetical protein
MPDTFGKRKRRETQAQKAAARDERREARKKRRAERPEGEEDWLAPPPEHIPTPTRPADTG